MICVRSEVEVSVADHETGFLSRRWRHVLEDDCLNGSCPLHDVIIQVFVGFYCGFDVRKPGMIIKIMLSGDLNDGVSGLRMFSIQAMVWIPNHFVRYSCNPIKRVFQISILHASLLVGFDIKISQLYCLSSTFVSILLRFIYTRAICYDYLALNCMGLTCSIHW